MFAELPSPRSQAHPRAILMRREGPIVPAATLRAMLRRGRPIRLVCSGYALEPLLRHEREFEVVPAARPAAGDLALCQSGGWADLRRILRVAPDGALTTALDAVPDAREPIEGREFLGRVRGVRGAGDRLGRLLVGVFPVWARVARFASRLRRTWDASSLRVLDAASVRDKYEQQVEGYREQLRHLPDPRSLEEACRSLPAGAAILVVGCGAGSEVLHLARRGFRVTGFDVSAGMVRACRETIAAAGLTAEVLMADLFDLDLGERSFEAIYFSPLVYSLLPGRSRRVRAVRRLGWHLAPGGRIVLSFQPVRSFERVADLWMHWIIARTRGLPIEGGDWYTTFLTPAGTIGRSFIHLFRPGTVLRELRRAGFRRVERIGPAHIAAGRFQRSGGEGRR